MHSERKRTQDKFNTEKLDSTPDFWGRGPRFESGISHNDPDALQDHCVIK